MASRQETARGAAFALDSIDRVDGLLTVTGRWSGVRGMRFVRPALVVDGRQLLAVLDHKPWAPDTDPWVAAFPWTGGEPDLDELSLSVAPSVTVALGAAPPEPPADPEPQADVAIARLQSEVRFLREDRRDELERARREAERERDNALAQRAEAVADREAAMRTRDRLERQAEEAEEHRRAAEAERDDVLERLVEMRAHLDEVLLANRTLQQKLQAHVAGEQAAADASPPPPVPAPPPRPADDEEPIGVRAIPAARLVSPQLDRLRRDRELGASRFDLYAIRVLGTVAAVCFIALLVMFIRLFI